MERTLTSVEKASVLAGRTSSSDREVIERAWDPVLFNQTHDLSSGVMLDHVYEDVLAGYRFSKRLGDEMLGNDLDSLLAKVDTQGAGAPLAIFNFWVGTEPITWKPRWDSASQKSKALKLRGCHLAIAVPVQVLRSHSNGGDGGLNTATIGFIARDVPAMGYAIYHVVPIFAGAAGKRALADGKTRSSTALIRPLGRR